MGFFHGYCPLADFSGYDGRSQRNHRAEQSLDITVPCYDRSITTLREIRSIPYGRHD